MPSNDRREHNYVAKVLAFAREHNIPRGRLSEIGIYHDSWCGIHRGGRCNCNPDVKLLKTHPAPKRA